MAQAPAALTPLASAQHYFGAELRHWRRVRGMSLATLGQTVHVSGDLLGKVEKAQRWPARDLVQRCDLALDSCGTLVRLYRLAESERRGRCEPEPSDQPSARRKAPLAPALLLHDVA